MKIIIVSGYVGIDIANPPRWLARVMANHQKYALASSVDYVFETQPAPQLVGTSDDLFHLGSASKPFYLKKYLDLGYDYCAWVDPDAFILNRSWSIPILFKAYPGTDTCPAIAFTGDKASIYNGGHLLVRNCSTAHKIIDEWIRVLETELPPIVASKILRYNQLTSTNNYLRGDQTALNIALTSMVLGPNDFLNGLSRSHRNSPSIDSQPRFIPPFTPAHCEYISNHLIRKDLRKFVRVLPQSMLNSYPVTSEPGSKYKQNSPHIHYAGASKYFLLNDMLLHELVDKYLFWRTIYVLSFMSVQSFKIDPLVLIPYLHKLLITLRRIPFLLQK